MSPRHAKKFRKATDKMTVPVLLAATLFKAGIHTKGDGREMFVWFKELGEPFDEAIILGVRNAYRDHFMGFIDLSKLPTISFPDAICFQ